MKSTCMAREDQRTAGGWVFIKGRIYGYESIGTKIEIETERGNTLINEDDFDIFFIRLFK